MRIKLLLRRLKNLGMVFEKLSVSKHLKLQRKIMRPPLKGAYTERLAALANLLKKAAIRVFFGGVSTGL